MKQWLYIAACVAVPGAWGAFSAWLFSRLDRRKKSTQDRPRIDYTI